MVDVEKMIKSRITFINSVHKLLDTGVKKIYLEYKEEDLDTLISSQEIILQKLKKITDIDEQISDLLTETGDFENLQKHSDDSIEEQIKIKRKLKELERFICKHSKDAVSDTISTTSVVVNRSTSMKLPRMNIRSFTGDPTEWTSFYDSFEAAIHKNESL